LLVKLTWSEKMTTLSTFLESSLNFIFNNLKKHCKIWCNQKKNELPETQFERTVRRKSPVKPTSSKKIIVLSTFLESSLNFLSSNTTKFGTVREKSGVKI